MLALLQDALEYGLIDEVIAPDAGKAEKAATYWLKSGRAESDGRLEQWKEYLELQEKYSMKDQFKKVCYIVTMLHVGSLNIVSVWWWGCIRHASCGRSTWSLRRPSKQTSSRVCCLCYSCTFY
jgi:hypothetical protein